MSEREQNIASTKRLVGWAYADMRWLDDERARAASHERDELLEAISGDVRRAFAANKLHLGELSPGCVACGEGVWACQYVNHRCTATCFFCPQQRKVLREPDPAVRQVSFATGSAFVDFLERFGFRGVAFSGGEPMLAVERVLAQLEMIRARLGKEIYVWVYTNGDRIDAGKLAELKAAGCDEIRFNIAARGYDLAPVELAARIVDRVTVEIPALPEDYDRVARSLRPMAEIGVRHLNLHQLNTTEYNYRQLAERGYSFLHHPLVPVLDTELTALRIMRLSRDEAIPLPINYCSCAYKERLQARGHRRRAAQAACAPHESVTDAGYIRRITVCGEPALLAPLAERLAGAGVDAGLWSEADSPCELYLHESLIDRIGDGIRRVVVSYDEADLTSTAPRQGACSRIRLSGGTTVHAVREGRGQRFELTPAGLTAFHKLYRAGEPDAAVQRWLTANYDVAGMGSIEAMTAMTREISAIKELRRWESLAEGLPELY